MDLGHRTCIERLRKEGRDPGGGVDSPELVSAVAHGSGSPELGVPAAPGAKLTWAWVRRDLRDMCDSPRAQAKHGEDSSDEPDGGATARRRRSRSGRYGRLKVTAAGAKGPEREGETHRGATVPEAWRRRYDDDDRRRKDDGARGQAATEGLEVPWTRGPVVDVPAEVTRS
jgi:hypothetical protein